MTPERAGILARELYGAHPAAPPLLQEAIHGRTAERRARAALALGVLDPGVPLDVMGAQFLSRLLYAEEIRG